MFRFWLSIAVAGVALAAVGAAQADRGVRPAEPAGKYMSGIVEQKLANHAWILGDELTIVDCLYAYLGQDFAKGQIPWEHFPALTAYVARLDARPALIRANAKTPR